MLLARSACLGTSFTSRKKEEEEENVYRGREGDDEPSHGMTISMYGFGGSERGEGGLNRDYLRFEFKSRVAREEERSV